MRTAGVPHILISATWQRKPARVRDASAAPLAQQWRGQCRRIWSTTLQHLTHMLWDSTETRLDQAVDRLDPSITLSRVIDDVARELADAFDKSQKETREAALASSEGANSNGIHALLNEIRGYPLEETKWGVGFGRRPFHFAPHERCDTSAIVCESIAGYDLRWRSWLANAL